MNYGFVIDNRKCIGCHACTVACKSEHEIPLGVNRTHVKYVEKGVFPETRRTFTVTRCNHCEAAPCVEICPTSALFTRRDGIVDFDSDRCIACRSCMQACPYDALYIDPETRTAAKCNYCAHRVERGYQPACVIVCPVQAIIAGDLDEAGSPIARLVGREEIAVRKPEKGTLPNVYYIDGDYAALNPLAAEPADSYLISEQSRGVGHYARWLEARREESGEPLFSPIDTDQTPGDDRGGVVLGGTVSLSQRAVDDVSRELAEAGRRVYDAPGKGILWGWQVPAYIWTKAVSTGTLLLLILLRWLADQPSTAENAAALGVSLTFLLLTGVLLIVDLDRPDRFHYVLLRPNWRSWLVRGAYVIAGLGAILTITLIALGNGWQAWVTPLLSLAFPLAVLGATYTAFLFAQAKGRDFWQSPISPVRMLNQALLAGTAVLILIGSGRTGELRPVLLGLVILNLVVLLLELWMPHASRDAARAAHLIARGPEAVIWWGGIWLGSALPLAMAAATTAPILVQTAATLALVGIFMTEYAWVKAPQRIPLA